MSFAASELRGHIENGGSFGLLSRQATNYFRCESRQGLSKVCAFKELFGVLVVGRSTPVAHLVEVDGKFCSVERFPFAQILARCHDLVPRFEGHYLSSNFKLD